MTSQTAAAGERAQIAPRQGATEQPPPNKPRPRRAGIWFVLPATIWIGIFGLVPVLFGFALSFTDYSPLARSGPAWAGLDNYLQLFGDAQFGSSLLVTGRYVLQVIVPLVPIALVLALLANRPFRGIGAFRAALYLPNIVSLTAVSMIWLWLYSRNGLVNEALDLVGLGSQRWLYEPGSALNAVVVMRVWKALGSNMVLLLAGLQSVPTVLYEAARVDGAGAWQRFRYVTLPGLRPMLTYVLAMDIVFLAQGFAEIFVLTGGGPLESTTTVNYRIYTEAFQYNQMGGASAMAFVLFALIGGLSYVSIRATGGRR